MNCKGKMEWAVLVHQWDTHQGAAELLRISHTEYMALKAHVGTIREWVYSDRPLEMWDITAQYWKVLNYHLVTFYPDAEYRVQPKEEDNVEQYSKEFWQQCLKMHTMHLSGAISGAISYHFKHIEAWVGGVKLEYKDPAKGWVAVPDKHHRFLAKLAYREAPPKLKQCDVVVYWREAVTLAGYTSPAGIDVARLAVEPTSPHAATLDSLQHKTPGFKLLSITRVVVDENHNLLEYSTKLDTGHAVAFGRVPS